MRDVKPEDELDFLAGTHEKRFPSQNGIVLKITETEIK